MKRPLTVGGICLHITSQLGIPMLLGIQYDSPLPLLHQACTALSVSHTHVHRVCGKDIQMISDDTLREYAALAGNPLHGDLAEIAKELLAARERIEDLLARKDEGR
jgi:hypothetical protein